MNTGKIDRTIAKALDMVGKLEKLFANNGAFEQSVAEVGGDISYFDDIAKKLEQVYIDIEDLAMSASGDSEQYESMTESRKLTEGVLDGDDEDGFMARSQLYFLAKDAITLHGMINDRDNLEPWVQAKITAAAEGMDAVRRYTEYQATKADMQLPVVADPRADRPVSIEMDGMEEAADNPYAVGMSQAMKSTGDRPPLKKATIRKAHDIAKAIQDESVKPDFLDMDGDGNKKEPMKKAAKDAKKKVAEEAKFDDNRDGELKTVAQDMFKNALAAAKKKATK